MREKKYPEYNKLTFRVHAVRQMFERYILDSDINHILETGIIIEDYPDDLPYPSCLVSGEVLGRPIHVVMAYNNVDDEAIVITAYEPDPNAWSDQYTRRRA